MALSERQANTLFVIGAAVAFLGGGAGLLAWSAAIMDRDSTLALGALIAGGSLLGAALLALVSWLRALLIPDSSRARSLRTRTGFWLLIAGALSALCVVASGALSLRAPFPHPKATRLLVAVEALEVADLSSRRAEVRRVRLWVRDRPEAFFFQCGANRLLIFWDCRNAQMWERLAERPPPGSAKIVAHGNRLVQLEWGRRTWIELERERERARRWATLQLVLGALACMLGLAAAFVLRREIRGLDADARFFAERSVDPRVAAAMRDLVGKQ